MKRIVMFLAISIVLLSISFAVIAQTNDIDLMGIRQVVIM